MASDFVELVEFVESDLWNLWKVDCSAFENPMLVHMCFVHVL